MANQSINQQKNMDSKMIFSNNCNLQRVKIENIHNNITGHYPKLTSAAR